MFPSSGSWRRPGSVTGWSLLLVSTLTWRTNPLIYVSKRPEVSWWGVINYEHHVTNMHVSPSLPFLELWEVFFTPSFPDLSEISWICLHGYHPGSLLESPDQVGLWWAVSTSDSFRPEAAAVLGLLLTTASASHSKGWSPSSSTVCGVQNRFSRLQRLHPPACVRLTDRFLQLVLCWL